MSAHSKPSTTRGAQKRKPGASATFAPRPRKQKPVGKRFASPVETLTASPTEGQPLYGYSFAFFFFRSRRLNDVLSPAVPKANGWRTDAAVCVKTTGGRLCSRLISVRFRPARSRGPAHAGPAYDASAHARARRSREKMH